MGSWLGERLTAGSVLALIGELGCGKTLFTRGLCEGLGVARRLVSSPTFVFVNEYPGRLPVFHMDLYRLDSVTQGFEIGILDYLARSESGVIIVEWAEKIQSLLPADCLRVDFQVLSARKRELALTTSGERYVSLFKGLEAK